MTRFGFMGAGFGRMGALGGAVDLGPAYDPSPFGLDALTSKYAIFSPAYRVLTSYSASGNLLRLRRSTDDAESDFAAVRATGLLDTAAVTSWLGGGTGYIVTLYDQSGNGYNASQATAANQPTLVLSGSIPYVQFPGTSGARLSVTTGLGFARNQGTASLLAVCQYPNDNVKSVMGVAAGGGNTRMVIQRTATTFRAGGRRLDADSQVNTTGLTESNSWVVQMAGFDWTNSNLHQRVEAASETNSSFQTDGSTSDTDSNPELTVGAQYFTNFFDGKATLFVFTRDLLSGTAASDLVTSLAALKVT